MDAAAPIPDSTGAVARCPRCALLVHSCLCTELVPLDLVTRVVVMRHRKETYKTTNSGRLVPLTISRGEIRVFGERYDSIDEVDLIDPARNTLLLYPSEDSRLLTRADGESRPVTLIVPDANWRRAFKLTSREPALRAVQRVHLPDGPPSNYRLRRHPDPRFLATFEAVARALGILEGAEVQAHLERVFALMVERTLQSRGRFATYHALDQDAAKRSVGDDSIGD